MMEKTQRRGMTAVLLMVLCVLALCRVQVRAQETQDVSETATDLSEATVTLSKTSYTYNGQARTPSVKVTLTQGDTVIKLKKDRDYTVSYKNNISAGTAKVILTGTGDYTGTVKETFTIGKKTLKAKYASLSKTSCTYSGSAKKPSVTISLTLGEEEVTLKKGTDYTVSYSGNTKVGKATVTIKGKGNYQGTVEKTFKILPKSTSLTSLTGISKGFTAAWKSVSEQASGYQIQYATNKSFTKGKGTFTVEGKKTDETNVTTVKGNKKYYVRIRTYKTVNGKNYYSAWSAVKKVTTKKRVTAFGGDSLMTGVVSYGFDAMDLEGSLVSAAYTSLNTKTFCTTKTSNGLTALQRVVKAQPYRLYIMLGMNEVTWKSSDAIKEDWITLIRKIQKSCPDTDIVVLSMSPVSKAKASSVTGFKKISKYNQLVRAAAEECGVTYYDFTASYKDSSGYLKSAYNGGDGIHWSRAGYEHFGEVISEYDAQLEAEK